MGDCLSDERRGVRHLPSILGCGDEASQRSATRSAIRSDFIFAQGFLVPLEKFACPNLSGRRLANDHIDVLSRAAVRRVRTRLVSASAISSEVTLTISCWMRSSNFLRGSLALDLQGSGLAGGDSQQTADVLRPSG
jgi:hypothetical protein